MQYASRNASFSSCQRYRYSLERSWSEGTGRVLFIGLNPSTADQGHDDPTIRRCVGFARSWGFRSMQMVNLFAFKAAHQHVLKQAADPVGCRNDRWIVTSHAQADQTIACWGNDGSFLHRADAIRASLKNLYCLKITRHQQPAHPLYLRATLTPSPWLPPARPTPGNP